MTTALLTTLVKETLMAPRDAARRLIGLNLSGAVAWQALALTIVLNSGIHSLMLQAAGAGGASGESPMMMPVFMTSPLTYTLIFAMVIAVSVLGLWRLGTALGGRARLTDIVVIVTWLQALRLLLQLAVVVLGTVIPGLVLMLVGGLSLYGIYILAAMLDAAHGFGSLAKSLFLMIGTMFLVIVIISMIPAAMMGV